jgi:Immunoglobulin I-set domain
MNFGWVYPEDSGEYVCRATNLYGMDETRAFIKTAGKPGIIYDSQLPKGMKSLKQIRDIEAHLNRVPEEKIEIEKEKMKPTFVLSPDPITVEEGEWARFCCRVTGHPRPRVMWLINGHTVVNVSSILTFVRMKSTNKLYYFRVNATNCHTMECITLTSPRADNTTPVKLKSSPVTLLVKPSHQLSFKLFHARMITVQS